MTKKNLENISSDNEVQQLQERAKCEDEEDEGLGVGIYITLEHIHVQPLGHEQQGHEYEQNPHVKPPGHRPAVVSPYPQETESPAVQKGIVVESRPLIHD